MSATTILAIALVVVVLVFVFARRGGTRQVGYGSESGAVRREWPQRPQSSATGSRAVESTEGTASRAVEAAPVPEAGRITPMPGRPRASAPWGPASALSPDDLAEVRQALSSGRKIEAIKLVRERTGLGLKEAKDFVESL